MGERLNNWTSRQKLSAAHLNEAWNVLRKIASVVGYDLNSVGKDSPADHIPRVKFGEVVAAGPASEADYSDPRYWIIDIAIDAASDSDAAIERSDMTPITYTSPVDNSDATVPVIHTVTNVPELLDNTHRLEVGTPVLYFELFDRADPTPNVRRVMAIGAPGGIDVFHSNVLFQAGVRSLNIATTRNTNAIFAWESTSLPGDPFGVSLAFQSGGANRQVLQFDGSGNVIRDYIRTY